MKRIILSTAFAVTFGVLTANASDDSFIYWMVDNNASGTAIGGAELAGSYSVRVSAFQSNVSWTEKNVGQQYLNIYSFANGGLGTDLGTTVENAVQIGQVEGAAPDNFQYFAKIASYDSTSSSYGSGYTYFVELWNDGAVVARSEGLPYSQDSIAEFSNFIATPGTLWSPMTFVAAPEPNSALLLLIGCAALALRRRKQVVA